MRWKRVSLYLILSFGFSWLIAVPLYISNLPYLSAILSPIYMFGPLLAVWILMLKYRDFGWSDIGVSFRVNVWWLVGWLFPVFLVLLTLLISPIFPDVSFSPDGSGFVERVSRYANPDEIKALRLQMKLLTGYGAVFMLILSMVVGATFNAIFAFGEEAGWRGFLYMELRKLGFWKMSYLVGFIWGLWHAPLILKGHNYPEHPVIGVFMMTLFTMLLSPILFFIREKAESVIAPSITHGTINAVGGFALLYIAGGNDLVAGITGLPGIIVLALFNVLIAMINRNKS